MTAEDKILNKIFYKYYKHNPELRRIVWLHSKSVALKALKICKEKDLPLEPYDVYMAAMLHDIGVVKCRAASIYARGKLPYLQHGIAGYQMLNESGLHKYSNICKTHIGTGISKEEIKERNLPLPYEDIMPETLLEKLICYSDNFYSKSHNLTEEKNFESVINQVSKLGQQSLDRFLEMDALFGNSSE